MLSTVFRYYPLTATGTLLFTAAVYLLGAGYARNNPYLIFLAAASFFVLLLCILLAAVQARRLNRADTVWDSREPLYAGRSGTREQFQVQGFRSWFFFRIHAVLGGRLELGKQAYFTVLRHGSFTGAGPAAVPLHFSLSGTYHGKGRFFIRDVFGLTRAYSFGLNRELPVHPPLLEENALLRIESSGGEDDKQKKKSSDEDKYYMREYIPGDRVRDINWKATSRVGELFTRISPVTEEKTKYLFIDFRHYKTGSDTLRTAAHLEALKRWLLSFLWQLKLSMPEYRCEVKSSRGRFAVETETDIRHLSLLLSGVYFERDPGEPPVSEQGGDVYIFTTQFDPSLPAAAAGYAGKRITVMQTLDAGPRREGDPGAAPVLEIPVFRNGGMIHYPGLWIAARSDSGGSGGTGRGNPAAVPGDVRREVRLVRGRLL